jgi:hypothetical protein
MILFEKGGGCPMSAIVTRLPEKQSVRFPLIPAVPLTPICSHSIGAYKLAIGAGHRNLDLEKALIDHVFGE